MSVLRMMCKRNMLGSKHTTTLESKTVYNNAKRVAKRVIWLAKLAAGPSGITEMLKALVKKVLN